MIADAMRAAWAALLWCAVIVPAAAQPQFRASARLVGVSGLRPLGDRVVTLDYPSRRWKLAD